MYKLKVHIPLTMRDLCLGREFVEANGSSVRQLILDLEESYPGVKKTLMNEDNLRPGVAVAVDGQIAPMGLFQSLKYAKQVAFIPAIGGG